MSRLTGEKLSRYRKSELGVSAKEVSKMAGKMLEDADEEKVARYLGVTPTTMRDKVNQGRFTSAELFFTAKLCGYSVTCVPRHKDLVS